MFNIAICDDSMIQQSLLREQISMLAAKKGIATKVEIFSTGELLLESVKAGKKFDVYILDIVLLGLKGNEVATKLREMGDEGFILFYTATRAYENEIDGVMPAAYLLKPFNANEFDAAMPW